MGLPSRIVLFIHQDGSNNRFGGIDGKQYDGVCDVVSCLRKYEDLIHYKSKKVTCHNDLNILFKQILDTNCGDFKNLTDSIIENKELFFYDFKNPTYTTQHDLEGKKFKRHPFGLKKSISEIKFAMGLLHFAGKDFLCGNIETE